MSSTTCHYHACHTLFENAKCFIASIVGAYSSLIGYFVIGLRATFDLHICEVTITTSTTITNYWLKFVLRLFICHLWLCRDGSDNWIAVFCKWMRNDWKWYINYVAIYFCTNTNLRSKIRLSPKQWSVLWNTIIIRGRNKDVTNVITVLIGVSFNSPKT